MIARNPGMQPGDVFVLNDPYHGGTHLPGHHRGHARCSGSPGDAGRFYVASTRPPCRHRWRHHAGLDAAVLTTIDREGVLLDNVLLVRDGQMREAEMRALLARRGALTPGAQPAANLADLRAQIAANEKGAQELRAMVAHLPGHREGLHAACAGQRRGIGAPRHHRAEGRRSRCRSTTAPDPGRRARGRRPHRHHRLHRHQPQQPNNFNAPGVTITTAAVLYVFRTLVDDDIPLNAGCLKPLQVIVPEGCMLNPQPPAAVVAGNVETSSCITNALFGALGVMAAASAR